MHPQRDPPHIMPVKKPHLFCPICSETFVQQRPWQLFCSNKCRATHNADKEAKRIFVLESRVKDLEQANADLREECSTQQHEVVRLTAALVRAVSQ
jgi:predicted nucleic acid-binding Zn ribbon protein